MQNWKISPYVEFLLEAISFANKQICLVFKCSIPPSVYLWILSSLLQSCLNETLLHKHGDETISMPKVVFLLVYTVDEFMYFFYFIKKKKNQINVK